MYLFVMGAFDTVILQIKNLVINLNTFLCKYYLHFFDISIDHCILSGQSLRRWSDNVQTLLYKWFVFAGYGYMTY